MLLFSMWLQVRMRNSRPSLHFWPAARFTAVAACGVKENSGLPPARGDGSCCGDGCQGIEPGATLGGPEGAACTPLVGVALPLGCAAGRGDAAPACWPCHHACSASTQSATAGRSSRDMSSKSAAQTEASCPISAWQPRMKLVTFSKLLMTSPVGLLHSWL
jgi:hypothetical protein